MSEARLIVHPLVIMNIADHQARTIAESDEKYDPSKPVRVLGALFGIQENQSVELHSSIELSYSLDDEKELRINDEEFKEDLDLHSQIYPEHECLGWYSTNIENNSKVDIAFHKRFTDYNESPLYLRMNPVIGKDAKALPVTLYRMELRTVKEVTTNVFVELGYKVVSDPAERLTVDHIIQDKDVPTKGSQVVRPYETLKNAIGSLQARIELLCEYLNRVENGKIEGNPEILKSIQSICNRLPTMTNEKFKQDFFTEMANGMMMTYLTSLTKAAQQVNQTMELNDTMMDNSNSRGGRRGGPAFRRRHFQ